MVHFIENKMKRTCIWDLLLGLWTSAEEGTLMLLAESDLI